MLMFQGRRFPSTQRYYNSFYYLFIHLTTQIHRFPKTSIRTVLQQLTQHGNQQRIRFQ
jgi:hypothetical protein